LISRPSKERVILLSSCVVMGVVGAFVLWHVYDAWAAQELWLKPRFSPKWLMRYEANPSEFVARLVFIGAGGLVLLCIAAGGLLDLIVSVALGQDTSRVSSFRRIVVLPFAVTGLAAFCVWIWLAFYLPVKYG
jgi:hypothetical protein